ncbi:transcription initiation factor IIE subunit beta [Trichomonascus vanleenenianus]|uniref:transcription factor TFIIE subunit TFA2 n=1 Tax=Trichomonascus vanleenenianus TaxID=2268995 RepID=UPI003ECA52C2
MSLNDQLNSFRNKVRNAPTIQKRVIQEPSNEKKRNIDSLQTAGTAAKKKKSNIVYSQPRSTGVGSHSSTQLVHAVEYIKRQDRKVKLSDVESYLSYPIAPLIPSLKRIDRIKINEADQTVEYVSIYNIYSADDLLRYLQGQPTFQGVAVKQLKDGWNGCNEAIETLESEQKIIVLRTKKENLPRYVWANIGGSIGGIDEAFTSLWSKAKVPSTSELPGALEKVGLKPTSVDPATIKKAVKKSESKKQKKPRRGKITNTHMSGILKDYRF